MAKIYADWQLWRVQATGVLNEVVPTMQNMTQVILQQQQEIEKLKLQVNEK
jgi:hypothetical protein